VVLAASVLQSLDLRCCTALRQLSVSARIDAPWLHALQLPSSLTVRPSFSSPLAPPQLLAAAAASTQGPAHAPVKLDITATRASTSATIHGQLSNS